MGALSLNLFDTLGKYMIFNKMALVEKLICNRENALLLTSEVMHFCFLEEIHSDLVNLSREYN